MGGDIFISSLQDIHVGSGRHLTISTQEDVIIESRNIYLGKKAHESPSEPLVLGQTLVDILGELIDILKEANSINLFGVLTPLADTKFVPLTTKLAPLQMKLKDMLSSFHYIEKNDTQKE